MANNENIDIRRLINWSLHVHTALPTSQFLSLTSRETWKEERKIVTDEAGNYGTFEVSSESYDELDTLRAIVFFSAVCERTLFTWRYILSCLSYVVLIAANHLVMLSVMTFNAWLLITVRLTTGLAYYFIPSSPRETRKLTCGTSEGKWELLSRFECSSVWFGSS